MQIRSILSELELIAPLSLQESYDNAGLLTGMPDWECTGVICTLDATEEVVLEAIEKGCNLIVAHHPIIFGGLKKSMARIMLRKQSLLPSKMTWRFMPFIPI